MRDQREWVCCRAGGVLHLHSSPFPLNGHGVSSRSPGAVKGARRLRVHRSEAETLDGEDERLRSLARERGCVILFRRYQGRFSGAVDGLPSGRAVSRCLAPPPRTRFRALEFAPYSVIRERRNRASCVLVRVAW